MPENTKGLIDNFEQARIGADAEKPLRDITKEKGWSEEERDALNRLAEKRGEIAMKGIAPQGHDAESENHTKNLVREAIDLIKESPDLTFVVFGIGNVLNQKNGSTNGGYGYYFSPEQQKMVTDLKGDFNFLDANPKKGAEDALFTPQWDWLKRNDGTYVSVRLPIRSMNEHNSFLSDNRTGVHLTLAIRYNDTKLPSMKNQELADKLRHPDIEFFSQLVSNCADKFIPDYYNYVMNLTKKHGPKIK